MARSGAFFALFLVFSSSVGYSNRECASQLALSSGSEITDTVEKVSVLERLHVLVREDYFYENRDITELFAFVERKARTDASQVRVFKIKDLHSLEQMASLLELVRAPTPRNKRDLIYSRIENEVYFWGGLLPLLYHLFRGELSSFYPLYGMMMFRGILGNWGLNKEAAAFRDEEIRFNHLLGFLRGNKNKKEEEGDSPWVTSSVVHRDASTGEYRFLTLITAQNPMETYLIYHPPPAP
jgi:hypothetical protein